MGFRGHALVWHQGWRGARMGAACAACGNSIEGVETGHYGPIENYRGCSKEGCQWALCATCYEVRMADMADRTRGRESEEGCELIVLQELHTEAMRGECSWKPEVMRVGLV